MKHVTAAFILLAACSQEAVSPPANEAEPANPAPFNPPAPDQPGGLPDDRTPVAEGPIDPKSPEGAGQVLQTYFALVEQGKLAEANRLWTDGAERLDLGRYQEVHANIGAPGNMEGAAGSSYVDFPVQLYGRLKSGQELNARGTMTLRRANDVPGSTPEQRSWRIYNADFPSSPAP